MSIARLIAICLSALSVACDDAPRAEPGSTTVINPDTSGASTASSGQPGTPCPRTGRWAVCSLEKRLEQAGFVLRKEPGDHPSRSGFAVRPIVYALGRARLEVFIYPDESALRRDVASIDTTLVAPRGKSNNWEIPPRFVRSENLAVVFLTRNEQQAERLMLAITAGPPQPDP